MLEKLLVLLATFKQLALAALDGLLAFGAVVMTWLGLTSVHGVNDFLLLLGSLGAFVLVWGRAILVWRQVAADRRRDRRKDDPNGPSE